MQIQVQEHCIQISGEVSVHTLTRLAYDSFIQYICQPDILRVDLSKVDKADSACVSLLLATARQRGLGAIEWIDVPQSVRDLTQLYEVQEWLNVFH